MENNNNNDFRYDEWMSRLMRMDDATWARHANGWSVWTRTATMPLLLLALWSHVWIGIGGATLCVALAVIWSWVNPRLFPAPKRTDTWHSRATFGERVWINRGAVPIPRHHMIAAHLLAGIAATGAVIGVWGAVSTLLWPTLTGLSITLLGKFWFLDRMVWLYHDMKDVDPIYRSWERIPVNDNGKPKPKRRMRIINRGGE